MGRGWTMRTKIEIDDGLMWEAMRGEKDRLDVRGFERLENLETDGKTFDLSCVVSAPGKRS
jgi:hypothetical protein